MKNKTVKPSQKGKKKGPRTVVTSELKKALLKDTLDLPVYVLAKKYHLDRTTVIKIIKENPMPPVITAREELDPLRRTELLAKDSTKVLELTIFSMKTLLETEIEAKKLDPTAKSTITIKELKDFFETVAPYVLQKVDSAPAKKGEKTPMAMVHNMFAKKPV